MTDLSITATLVVAGANAKITYGTAGVAITAGQAVFLDPTTGKWALADTDSATAAVRSAMGIALNGAALNQPIAVQSAGDITIGATTEAGAPYFLSGTAGGIAPFADVAAGDFPLILGMGKSVTVITLNIQYPAVVKA